MADLSLDEIIQKKKARNTSDGTLSLDDIIKKKNIRTFNDQGATVKRSGPTVKRLGQNQPMKTMVTTNNIVTDARSKIIQNKRQKIGDAREKLSRQTNAREGLNRLSNRISTTGNIREGLNRLSNRIATTNNAKEGLNRLSNRVATTGNNARQGINRLSSRIASNRIGGQAGQNRTSAPGLRTQRSNINPTANNRANQQGMRAPMREMQGRPQNVRVQRATYQSHSVTPEMVWEPGHHPQEPVAYRQAQPVAYRQAQPVAYRQAQPVAYSNAVYEDEMDAPISYRDEVYDDEMDEVYEDEMDAPIAYRDEVYDDEMDAPIVYVDEFGAPIRKKPVYVEAPRSRPVIRKVPVYVEAPRSRPAPIREVPVPVYVEAPRSRPVPMRPSNLAARMEQQRPRMEQQRPRMEQQRPRMEQQRPQQRPQQPPQPRGYKVMVNNLHPSVSGEDMEELFSTVGKIISSRMIRDGVAEGIFLKEDSALKFVDVYHNRSLDGQRMNVKILNQNSNVQRGRSGYY